MTTIKLSRGFGVTSAAGKVTPSSVVTAQGTWAGLHQDLSLVVPHKAHAYFSPGLQPDVPRVGDATNRHKETGFNAEILPFDFDGDDGKGIPLVKLAETEAELTALGLAWITAPSYSHPVKSAPGHTRCRLILRSVAPIATPEEYGAAWQYWADWLQARGLNPDTAPRHIAAAFYVGRAEGSRTQPDPENPEAPYAWPPRVNHGSGFGPECRTQLKVSAPTVKRSTSSTNGAVGRLEETPTLVPLADRLEALTNLLVAHGPCVQGQGGRDHAFKAGRHLVACGLTPSEATPAIQAWNQTCLPPWDLQELQGQVSQGWSTSNLPWGCKVQHLAPVVPFQDRPGVHTVVSPSAGYFLDGKEREDLLAQVGLPDSSAAVFIYDAPTGTGKTSLIRRWLKRLKAKKPTATVGVVADSIALVGSLAQAYGLPKYSETKNPQAQEVVTTIHSLHHFSPFATLSLVEDDSPNYRWDFFAIDEATAVRSTLRSKILGEKQAAKENLLAHVVNAHTSVLSSADIGPEIDWWIDSIQARCPGRPIFHVVQKPIQGRKSLQVTTDKAVIRDQLATLLACAGQGKGPLVYAVAAKKRAREAAEQIGKSHPTLRVFWVSSENSSDPDVKRILSNPNQMLVDYDVIIHTASIRTGISWDGPVCGVIVEAHSEVPSEQICQSIDRARQAKVVWVYVNPRKDPKANPDKDYLAQVVLSKAKVTQALTSRIKDAELNLKAQSQAWAPLDQEYFDSWLIDESKLQRKLQDPLADLIREATRYGWTVNEYNPTIDPDEDKARRVKEGEARDTIAAERREEVTTADRIDATTAETLKARHDQTREELAQVERHTLETFYGQELTPALYDLDRQGKTRKEVRLWVDLLAHNTDLQSVRDLKEAGEQVTDYRHKALQTKLRHQIVTTILGGVSPRDCDGMTLTAQEILPRAQALLALPGFAQKLRTILNTKLLKMESEDALMVWALAQLKAVGIQIKTSRPKGGQRVRTLSTANVRALAKAELRRARRTLAYAKGVTAPKEILPPPIPFTTTVVPENNLDVLLSEVV